MSSSEVNPQKPFNIAIIGGGLAGVALAIALIKHNIPTHIYEAAPNFAEIGLGVSNGPNAVRALGLIDPRLRTAYDKCATYNASPELANTWLTFRYGMDARNGSGRKAGDVITYPEWPEKDGIKCRSSMHQAAFLGEMVKLIPEGATSFGKTLVGIEELSEEGVKLSFADGTDATAIAVVGCDGVKSRTREILYGEGKVVPIYTGEYRYQSLFPIEEAKEVLGKEIATNGQLFCGYGGYAITYPVEQGKFFNMFALRRGPVSLPDATTWVMPCSKEEMLQDFVDWHPGLVELLTRFENTNKWALFDLAHDEKYYRGRICLMGDSAHATTPNLGGGMGIAMEDAYILGNLLAAAKGLSDIESAFKAYDVVRRPRTQRLIRESRRIGLTNEFLAEGIKDDVGKLMKDRDDLYRWLWDFDLEAQLEEAKQLMK